MLATFSKLPKSSRAYGNALCANRTTSSILRFLPQACASASLQITRYISSTQPNRLASIDNTESPSLKSDTPSFGPASYVPSAAAKHASGPLRNDWTKAEIQAIHDSPLIDLMFHAANVHRQNHNPLQVQQCTLLSIKTGGCTEDCAYCPQSSRHATEVKATKLMENDEVLQAARRAKAAGSSRFCMGTAWRDLNGRKTNFNKIVSYVEEIRGMGMEVCCTLGMLDLEQALKLKAAGLTAYNHNVDTSREYYPNIITTRSYDERLQTIQNVQEAGISVCSGGIIGLGEEKIDRIGMLHTLATLPEHPESVPINSLIAVKGTPLEDQEPIEIWEMIRMIATARIIMPRAMVRLSAGRVRFTPSEQALCFMAGANSIFSGDKLLTTPNNDKNEDAALFEILGVQPKPANLKQGCDKEVKPQYVSAAHVEA